MGRKGSSLLAQHAALLEKSIQSKAEAMAQEETGAAGEGRGTRGEPWERECDLRSTRYAAGEYRLELGVPAQVVGMEASASSVVATTIIIKEDMKSLGTRVWDCAALMSKWAEKTQQLERWPWRLAASGQPLRVLELGAGTGLLAIALAKLGAAVVATEYGPIVPHMAECCRENGVLLERSPPEDGSALSLPSPSNLVGGMVICHELDWYALDATGGGSDGDKSGATFDLVLVSDCTLTPSDAVEILKVVKHFAPPGSQGIDIVVGACHQREGTPTFIKAAEEVYGKVEFLDKSEQAEGYSSNRHMIMRIRP